LAGIAKIAINAKIETQLQFFAYRGRC
jgi:hypothetical protein